jgi:flagellar basal-body rod protein FlgC
MALKISDFFSTFKISAAGLSAEKRQLGLTAENIANANTTRTDEGTPYRRKQLIREMISRRNYFNHELKNANLRLQTNNNGHFAVSNYKPSNVNKTGGSEIKTEVNESNEFKQIYDPSHPDADQAGFVQYPDINVVSEMLELISSSRSYEANVTVMNATKNLARKSFDI